MISYLNAMKYYLGIGLLCCQLAVSAQEPRLLDRIVAVVNDEVITESALREELRAVESELRRQGTRLPSQRVLEKQMLERMVVTRLQLQVAERLGMEVDENTLNEALRDIAAQENMSLEQFRRALEQEGYSFPEFRETIREQLTIKRLHQRQVVSRINVTEQEINNFLTNQARQGNTTAAYRLQHILIAVPDAASPEVIQEKREKAEAIMRKLRAGADFQEIAVAESDSRQALEGGDLGWRKSGEIPSLFMDVVPRMAEGDIEGPIRNAGGFHIIRLAGLRSTGRSVITQTHARHILIKTNEVVSDNEAEERLKKLRQRIVVGEEDFAELARAHSEDPGSSTEGGDLGWISPGSLVSEFEEEIDRLRSNEISEPFKTRYGWHIVQVLDRREHDNTEDALRTRAARQIRERKIEEELQNWLRQLRDEAYVEYRLEGFEEED